MERLPKDPARLRALLRKVTGLIHSERDSLVAQIENLGGQAPETQDDDYAEDPAVQIRQVLSQWYKERSALEALVERCSTIYQEKRKSEAVEVSKRCRIEPVAGQSLAQHARPCAAVKRDPAKGAAQPTHASKNCRRRTRLHSTDG